MKKLYLMMGCPGSGKSTWLAQHTKSDDVIISRDEIRFTMLKDGDDYFAHENEVFKKYVERINDELKRGKNVFADATHLNYGSRIKLLSRVKGAETVGVIFMDTPLETCKARNAARVGKEQVPEKQLENMFHAIRVPNLEYEDIDELYIIKENEPIKKIMKE